MKKSLKAIDKELDLVRFIRRMRMNMTALMGLLNANQRIYVTKITRKMVLFESSDALSNNQSDEDILENF